MISTALNASKKKNFIPLKHKARGTSGYASERSAAEMQELYSTYFT